MKLIFDLVGRSGIDPGIRWEHFPHFKMFGASWRARWAGRGRAEGGDWIHDKCHGDGPFKIAFMQGPMNFKKGPGASPFGILTDNEFGSVPCQQRLASSQGAHTSELSQTSE